MTVCPAEMVTLAGLNVDPVMLTSTVEVLLPVAVDAGVGAGVDVAVPHELASRNNATAAIPAGKICLKISFFMTQS